MSAAFMIGFGVPILAGGLIYLGLLLVQRNKGESCASKYDERQVAARGRAFQAGFFTLLVGCGLAAGMEAAEAPWLNQGEGVILAILVGVLVFALVAIHQDAYMGLNQKPRKFLAGMGLIMLGNLACGVIQLVNSCGEGWPGRINLMVAAMMLIVIVAQGIHLLRLRRGTVK